MIARYVLWARSVQLIVFVATIRKILTTEIYRWDKPVFCSLKIKGERMPHSVSGNKPQIEVIEFANRLGAPFKAAFGLSGFRFRISGRDRSLLQGLQGVGERALAAC